VAIFYGGMTFPSANINVRAARWKQGAAGTIYLRDNALSHGVLLVNNGSIVSSTNTPLRTQLGRSRTCGIGRGRLVLVSTDVAAFT